MLFQDSPIPRISISPPPEQDLLVEPYSPFPQLSCPLANDDDGFRPSHLTPPPTVASFKHPRSPLRQLDVTGRGLESDRFQALLKATKERSAISDRKKDLSLRKEIALKVHKTKQVERRALFLSKVQAPPSPTATGLPKTPPDSPAIFHYSLPSPGLVSPLALFETLDGSRDGWVEQVDFRLGGDKPKVKSRPALPSLDQISARLIPKTARQSDYELENTTPTTAATARPSIGVGRLKMPLRSKPAATTPTILVTSTTPRYAVPPKSPLLENVPELHVTTMRVPRMNTTSLTKLTENNLNALNSRDQRAVDMLSTLRRRTSPPTDYVRRPVQEAEEQKWRRRSAPADMSWRARSGFEHPVLALPGGF